MISPKRHHSYIGSFIIQWNDKSFPCLFATTSTVTLHNGINIDTKKTYSAHTLDINYLTEIYGPSGQPVNNILHKAP